MPGGRFAHGHGQGESQSQVQPDLFEDPEINILSGARYFLFGSRDVWFVVGLPVFLASVTGWNHIEVGSFRPLGCGLRFCPGRCPALLGKGHHGRGPQGSSARNWALLLAVFPAGIAIALMSGLDPAISLIVGLFAFGAVFAINSAVHSYLILAYSDHDKVAMNVAFYMANAAGRLTGTVLSGWVYQTQGLRGVCGGPPVLCWRRP